MLDAAHALVISGPANGSVNLSTVILP